MTIRATWLRMARPRERWLKPFSVRGVAAAPRVGPAAVSVVSVVLIR